MYDRSFIENFLPPLTQGNVATKPDFAAPARAAPNYATATANATTAATAAKWVHWCRLMTDAPV